MKKTPGLLQGSCCSEASLYLEWNSWSMWDLRCHLLLLLHRPHQYRQHHYLLLLLLLLLFPPPPPLPVVTFWIHYRSLRDFFLFLLTSICRREKSVHSRSWPPKSGYVAKKSYRERKMISFGVTFVCQLFDFPRPSVNWQNRPFGETRKKLLSSLPYLSYS